MQAAKSKDIDYERDFESFIDRRLTAARAYVAGNAEPLAKIVTRTSPATFFGPTGGIEEGSDRVSSVYERDVENFGEGGETRFAILQKGASDDLAFWTGFQTARVFLGEKKGGRDEIESNGSFQAREWRVENDTPPCRHAGGKTRR